MSLPQFLNYLRFLRWRRSSSKTKACKFFKYSFSARSRCTSASRSSSTAFGSCLGRPLLPRPRRSTVKTFRSFHQVDPLPIFDSSIAAYFKPSCCFPVTQLFRHHRFYHQFLKFWCVSFVWYSFWHNKAPHLLFSIPYCLTNGVQFIWRLRFCDI